MYFDMKNNPYEGITVDQGGSLPIALIRKQKFEKLMNGTQNGYKNTRQTQPVKTNTITYH